MILPNAKRAERRRRRKKRLAEEAASDPALPAFKPGRNPMILGGAILLFIILGSMLTSQLSAPKPAAVQERMDPSARAWREVQVLTTALQRFYRDTGTFPAEEQGLVALVRDPGIPGWKGHYVNLIQPDPWRTPYRYSITEAGPEVRSAGPDRTFGTDADIFRHVDEDTPEI
jgi:general secretion pathway protein G